MLHFPAVLMIICVGLRLPLQSYTECMLEEDETVIVLRRYRALAVAGRFRIHRDQLETVLTDFKEKNEVHADAELRLATALPGEDYDERRYGEIMVFTVIYTETYFDTGLNANATMTRRAISVATPILSKGSNGTLLIAEITDKSPPLPDPYDQIFLGTFEDTWNCSGQTVEAWKEDGSIFRVTVRYNAMCIQDRAGEGVGEDFDRAYGVDIRINDFKELYDWGCRDDATAPAYCDTLDEHRSEIETAAGNLCVHFGHFNARRCVANYMSVDVVTGEFLKALPFLENNVTSFETEFFDGEYAISVSFPCYE